MGIIKKVDVGEEKNLFTGVRWTELYHNKTKLQLNCIENSLIWHDKLNVLATDFSL